MKGLKGEYKVINFIFKYINLKYFVVPCRRMYLAAAFWVELS